MEAIENIDALEVEVNMVEDDTNEDEWIRQFLEYLITRYSLATPSSGQGCRSKHGSLE